MLTCPQFRDQVLEWAAGVLSPDEEEAMEAHLRGVAAHERCDAEAAHAFDTAALLAGSLAPQQPDPGVWTQIEARLHRPDGIPDVAACAARSRRWRGREMIAWFVAAAAVIALVVIGHRWSRTSTELAIARSDVRAARQQAALRRNCERDLDSMRARFRQQEDAVALLRRPGTQVVPLAAQGNSRMAANAILNPRSDQGYVLVGGVRPVSGKDLELWVIRGQDKLPAGLLHPDSRGRALHPIAGTLLTDGLPDALAVTVEPKGGSLSPTGPIVLVGKPRRM